MYHYRAFGFSIASEYELPELETVLPPVQPDVRIFYGETPQILEGAAMSFGHHLQIAHQSLLLRIRAAGDLWIRNGNEIIINPLPDAPPENVRLFLLGSAFGALLHQRGILPIHGSALTYLEQTFILTGIAGVGKSTLAAVLIGKGCRLLTDDVAAITFDPTGMPWVQPAYPQQKLWCDSLATMKLTPGRLIRIMADIEKYAVPMGEYYQREPKILTAVFHMIKPTDDEIEKSSLEPIQGGSKTPLILRNVYRPYFVRGLGMQGELLQKCFDLAGKIKMAQMCRTKDLRELEKLAEMFLERLKIDG